MGNPILKGKINMLQSSSISIQPGFRLNDFIFGYIQRNGLPYVVDNYCPLREAYYNEKAHNGQQENDTEGEPSDV